MGRKNKNRKKKKSPSPPSSAVAPAAQKADGPEATGAACAVPPIQESAGEASCGPPCAAEPAKASPPVCPLPRSSPIPCCAGKNAASAGMASSPASGPASPSPHLPPLSPSSPQPAMPSSPQPASPLDALKESSPRPGSPKSKKKRNKKGGSPAPGLGGPMAKAGSPMPESPLAKEPLKPTFPQVTKEPEPAKLPGAAIQEKHLPKKASSPKPKPASPLPKTCSPPVQAVSPPIKAGSPLPAATGVTTPESPLVSTCPFSGQPTVATFNKAPGSPCALKKGSGSPATKRKGKKNVDSARPASPLLMKKEVGGAPGSPSQKRKGRKTPTSPASPIVGSPIGVCPFMAGIQKAQDPETTPAAEPEPVANKSRKRPRVKVDEVAIEIVATDVCSSKTLGMSWDDVAFNDLQDLCEQSDDKPGAVESMETSSGQPQSPAKPAKEQKVPASGADSDEDDACMEIEAFFCDDALPIIQDSAPQTETKPKYDPLPIDMTIEEDSGLPDIPKIEEEDEFDGMEFEPLFGDSESVPFPLAEAAPAPAVKAARASPPKCLSPGPMSYADAIRKSVKSPYEEEPCKLLEMKHEARVCAMPMSPNSPKSPLDGHRSPMLIEARVASPVHAGSPARVSSPIHVGNPPRMASPAHVGSPARVASPVHIGNPPRVGSPAHVGSPARVASSAHVGSPARVASPTCCPAFSADASSPRLQEVWACMQDEGVRCQQQLQAEVAEAKYMEWKAGTSPSDKPSDPQLVICDRTPPPAKVLTCQKPPSPPLVKSSEPRLMVCNRTPPPTKIMTCERPPGLRICPGKPPAPPRPAVDSPSKDTEVFDRPRDICVCPGKPQAPPPPVSKLSPMIVASAAPSKDIADSWKEEAEKMDSLSRAMTCEARYQEVRAQKSPTPEPTIKTIHLKEEVESSVDENANVRQSLQDSCNRLQQMKAAECCEGTYQKVLAGKKSPALLAEDIVKPAEPKKGHRVNIIEIDEVATQTSPKKGPGIDEITQTENIPTICTKCANQEDLRGLLRVEMERRAEAEQQWRVAEHELHQLRQQLTSKHRQSVQLEAEAIHVKDNLNSSTKMTSELNQLNQELEQALQASNIKIQHLQQQLDQGADFSTGVDLMLDLKLANSAAKDAERRLQLVQRDFSEAKVQIKDLENENFKLSRDREDMIPMQIHQDTLMKAEDRAYKAEMRVLQLEKEYIKLSHLQEVCLTPDSPSMAARLSWPSLDESIGKVSWASMAARNIDDNGNHQRNFQRCSTPPHPTKNAKRPDHLAQLAAADKLLHPTPEQLGIQQFTISPKGVTPDLSTGEESDWSSSDSDQRRPPVHHSRPPEEISSSTDGTTEVKPLSPASLQAEKNKRMQKPQN